MPSPIFAAFVSHWGNEGRAYAGLVTFDLHWPHVQHYATSAYFVPKVMAVKRCRCSIFMKGEDGFVLPAIWQDFMD